MSLRVRLAQLEARLEELEEPPEGMSALLAYAQRVGAEAGAPAEALSTGLGYLLQEARQWQKEHL